MFDLLKQLCSINGTSGDEDRVAEFIMDKCELYTEQNRFCGVVRRDALGNVLVFKKGLKASTQPVMFAAHMDEVGFIVTGVTKEGFLHFAPVGGINAGAVFGRTVVFENGVVGVVAGKPVHLLSKKEKDSQPKIEDLLIDIGVVSADGEAEVKAAGISPGDFCYFAEKNDELFSFENKSYLCAKAIDDRVGCAIMLDMLKHELEFDCIFAFTVQEEIGCRGAAAAAFNLEPSVCVVLEATTACDIAGVSGDEKICALGEGPVVSFMDKGTMYDRELYAIAVETAKENNIKIQTKSKVVGGNDASVIHKSVGGIRTIAVSAPCRYIHTPSCAANSRDIAEMRALAEKLLCKFAILQ